MIVKNEENTLKKCLDSVKGVFDEIIIVDTGSIDGTKREAASYTDKIYDFEWRDDFAAARNFSFSKATADFIMWLDADDVVEDGEREKLLGLKERLTNETDVVMMKYAASFDENGNATFFYYRERLIRRGANLKWQGFVHEVIAPAGNVIYEDIQISHKPSPDKRSDPTRNLRIYESKRDKGFRFGARETYYYARELYYNGMYDRAAKNFEQFLEMKNGWFADKIGACIMLSEIYKESDAERSRGYLAKALSYDVVNPQILCLMGDAKLEASQYDQAIFWYDAALSCPAEYKRSGFIQSDYERYYPLLQLCLCYDRLGEHAKAKEYNSLAGILRPDSKAVRYNEKYFEELERNGGEQEEVKSEE